MPRLRRLEPCLRRGPGPRRARSSRIACAQTLVLERSVSVREGDAVLAAIPAVRRRLTLAYHLDYGRGAPIAAQSFCLGLVARVVPRRAGGQPHFPAGGRGQCPAAAGIGAADDRGRPLDLRPRRRDRQCAALPRRVRAAQDPRHGRRPGAPGFRPPRVRGRPPIGTPDQPRAGAQAARAGRQIDCRRPRRCPARSAKTAAGHRGDHEAAAASLSVPAGGPGARARAGPPGRGDQERERQRAVLRGALAGAADHAGRADRRGDRPGRRRLDRRQRSSSRPTASR